MPLNSPLEVGVRIVFFLESAFPRRFDLNQLVLADYLLLHSQDHGGPSNLHPSLPLRQGELGIKRKAIQDALEPMAAFDLVEVSGSEDGIVFGASDRAFGFVRLFESAYASRLTERAQWVVDDFGNESVHDSSERIQEIASAWPDGLSVSTISEWERQVDG